MRKQLIGILDRHGMPLTSCGKDTNKIRKSFCAGYFNHACKRGGVATSGVVAKGKGKGKDGGKGKLGKDGKPMSSGIGEYVTLVDQQMVFIHPSSSLYQKSPEWVIYHELTVTTKEYMREVLTIEPHWLPQLAPNLFQKADAGRVSKRKLQERIQPLHNRFEEPDAWRLSRRKG